jgi:TonB-linked SusC/RagA family outer membrane protein
MQLTDCLAPPRGALTKILWIMKLLTVFLLVTSFTLTASTDAQRISLDAKNASLQKVFREIRKQTGYEFLYNDEMLRAANPVTIVVSNASLNDVLDSCFSHQPLTYVLIEKTIVVKLRGEPDKPREAPHPVTGRVVDESGSPLVNVSVVVKGTKRGTVTDDKGGFTIPADNGEVLVFSMIGFTTKEQKVLGDNAFNIVLVLSNRQEGEAVVVAYGTQQKATVTGSVVQARGEDLAKAPVGTVVNALEGRLPGLTFLQSSGQPGSDAATINIRGFGTPLVVVDGVPSDFTQLDPSEIESISILKDGAAAVYGFAAANGAIIVTTKHGHTGAPTIDYSGYYGLQQITRYPKLMNAGQFTELTDESQVNQGLPVVYGASEVQQWQAAADSAHRGTDWYNTVVRESTPMSYSNVNVTGGNDAVKYFFSGGYLDQEEMWHLGNGYFRRYNIRSNISAKISKRWTAELNVGGRIESRYNPNTSVSSIMGNIQRTYPTNQEYANNNPGYLAATNISNNPVAWSDSKISGYDNNQWRVFTGIGTLQYDIPFIDGLNAKLLFGYESDEYNDKDWVKSYNLYSYDPTAQAYNIAYVGNSPSNMNLYSFQEAQTNLQLSLNYAHTFATNNHVKGLLLLERSATQGTNFGATRNFSIDALDQFQLGDLTGQSTYVTTGSLFQTAYQGYVGRINYDFKGKYLVELAARYDYSWKFPDNAGFFPSVSAGWVISREPFFQVPVISNLKLRASWAEVPDDGSAAGFQYLTGYNYPSGSYVFSPGTVTNGLAPSQQANPSLTWQVGHLYNAGLELGFWSNMLTTELDVFYRERTGLPATAAQVIPGTVGVGLPQQNLNSDNTRGFEWQVSFNKTIDGVRLGISPNLTWTRTQDDYIAQAPYTNGVENYMNNLSKRWTDITWGYKAVGQFKSQADINAWADQDGQGNTSLKPGDVKYADVNHDGVLDSRDVVPIGRGQTPTLYYGLDLTAAYKGFDLDALFAGAGDFNITYSGEMSDPFFNNSNSYAFFTNRWHHANIYDPTSPWIPGKLPSTVANGTNNNNGILTDGVSWQSSFWLQNATYLRLKTLQVGYSLPARTLRNTGIKQVRVYFSGQNLFLLTKVSYLDPEAPPSSAGGGTGAYYPQQRVLTLGLSARF